MQVNIQITGLDEVRAQLGSLAKQANFAASKALNNTAYAVNAKLKTEMARTFAGGATGYTLQAFKVDRADKANLTAMVSLRKDGPAGTGTPYHKALAHLFTGGERKFKKLEGYLRGVGLLPNGYAVAPGEFMPLDRYGNMKRAALTELLGVLKSQRTNMRVYRKTGAGKAQKAIGYFVIKDKTTSKLHPGIYRRIETGPSSTIQPMILFVDPVKYRRFIDLEKIGREVVDKTFQPEFDKALSAAIRSAR